MGHDPRARHGYIIYFWWVTVHFINGNKNKI